MITAKFEDQGEIRMGSPHHVYSLELEGDWVPDLPKHDWQNLFVRSPDGRYLALTRWETTGNSPGFSVVLIDTFTRTYFQSAVIMGICTKIEWSPEGVVWTARNLQIEQTGTVPVSDV